MAKLSPLKTARHSNTIDNVKAKIDNVKAKIQDKEEKGPWSRPSLARRPVFSQLAASPTSFPLEEPFSTSHEKSPPRTRSLCLTREVSALHEKSPPRTKSLRLAREVRLRLVRGPRHATRASPPTRVEKRISTSRRNNRWRPCRRPIPARALMQV
jgi:hypothetical protein